MRILTIHKLFRGYCVPIFVLACGLLIVHPTWAAEKKTELLWPEGAPGTRATNRPTSPR